MPHAFGKSFAPDTPKRSSECAWRLNPSLETSGVVLAMRRKDNGKPFWIQWWSRPDPSGKFTRTIFLDITERVLMEQKKARIEAQNTTYLQEEIRSEHTTSAKSSAAVPRYSQLFPRARCSITQRLFSEMFSYSQTSRFVRSSIW